MALRTSTEKVKEILGKNYDTSDSGNRPLAQFMQAANLLTTRVAAAASAKGLPLSATELESIESWLTAHYYNCSDPAFKSRAVMGVSATYQGQTGIGLESSLYGQAALEIDYSGSLRNINKQQRAGMNWLGKAPSEQIDYTDRD